MKVEDVLTLLRAGYTKEEIAGLSLADQREKGVSDNREENGVSADANPESKTETATETVSKTGSNNSLPTPSTVPLPLDAVPTVPNTDGNTVNNAGNFNSDNSGKLSDVSEDRLARLEESIGNLVRIVQTNAIVNSNIPQTTTSPEDAIINVANAILNPNKESV